MKVEPRLAGTVPLWMRTRRFLPLAALLLVISAPRAAPAGDNPRPAGGKKIVLADGVEWLAAHQSADGGWDAAGFGQWCEGRGVEGAMSDGAGKPGHDVAATGLAVLAFLAAGYTNRGEHPFNKAVQNGLRYLKNRQDADGCFGLKDALPWVLPDPAVATVAMIEAYGMSGSPIYLGPSQKALDYLRATRARESVWGSKGAAEPVDAAATTWATIALVEARTLNDAVTKSGKTPPLKVDEEAFPAIRSWIEKRTDPETGRVGPKDGESGMSAEALTGAALWTRRMLGEGDAADAVRKSAGWLADSPPTWPSEAGSKTDMLYLLFGRNGVFQVGGDLFWKRWEPAMRKALDGHRRGDGDVCGSLGSWDPADTRIADGGRVVSTALMSLCEMGYPYDRAPGFPR